MAEEPTTAPPKGKGSGLKGKIAGVPKPLVLGGLGVALYLGYRWYKNRQAASTSSTATPTATTGTTPDTSGGYTGGGSGPDPNQPDPGVPGTPIPTSTPGTAPPVPTPTSPSSTAVTPIGNQAITVGGKAFNTVANFTQGGKTYYGIDNPTEAKQLQKEGVTLERNPNDPTGKGLFAVLPAGAKSIPVKAPAAPAKAPAKAKTKAKA